jgi:hypothetical protein
MFESKTEEVDGVLTMNGLMVAVDEKQKTPIMLRRKDKLIEQGLL